MSATTNVADKPLPYLPQEIQDEILEYRANQAQLPNELEQRIIDTLCNEVVKLLLEKPSRIRIAKYMDQMRNLSLANDAFAYHVMKVVQKHVQSMSDKVTDTKTEIQESLEDEDVHGEDCWCDKCKKTYYKLVNLKKVRKELMRERREIKRRVGEPEEPVKQTPKKGKKKTWNWKKGGQRGGRRA